MTVVALLLLCALLGLTYAADNCTAHANSCDACLKDPACSWCAANAGTNATSLCVAHNATSSVCSGYHQVCDSLNCDYVCKEPCSSKDDMYPCSHNVMSVAETAFNFFAFVVRLDVRRTHGFQPPNSFSCIA